MSIAPREAKWTMPSRIRPGQLVLGQKRIASPAGRSTGVPQLGHSPGISNFRCFGFPSSSSSRRSGSERTTWGITSPARITSTQSPSRMSFWAISSSLCSVALLTVTPLISTGSSVA